MAVIPLTVILQVPEYRPTLPKQAGLLPVIPNGPFIFISVVLSKYIICLADGSEQVPTSVYFIYEGIAIGSIKNKSGINAQITTTTV